MSKVETIVVYNSAKSAEELAESMRQLEGIGFSSLAEMEPWKEEGEKVFKVVILIGEDGEIA